MLRIPLPEYADGPFALPVENVEMLPIPIPIPIGGGATPFLVKPF